MPDFMQMACQTIYNTSGKELPKKTNPKVGFWLSHQIDAATATGDCANQ
jgi:hypothetical protein